MEEVANENHLFAPERQGISHNIPKGVINSINHITPNHGNFIYDDCVNLLDNRYFGAIDVSYRLRRAYLQRQAKERVDSFSTCQHRCDARRSKHDEVLVYLLLDSLKKCGLTSPSLSREEKAGISSFYQLICLKLLLVCFIYRHPNFEMIN